jgi:hypothetical protein
MATTKQVWRCPTCKDIYRSPVFVVEVLCPKKHVGGAGARRMDLIEGALSARR